MSLQFQNSIENYINYYDNTIFGQLQLFTNFAIDYIRNYTVSKGFVESIKQTMVEMSELEKDNDTSEIETLESQSKKILSYINIINSFKYTTGLDNFFLLQEEALNSKLTEINNRLLELNSIIQSIDEFVDLMLDCINNTCSIR